jgi:cell division protein ZapA
MKQIEVQIMGQSYLLASSDDGETLLRQAVMKVDTAMCQIRDAGKIKARDRIAVLAALNIAAQSLATQAAVQPQSDNQNVNTTTPQSHDFDDLVSRIDQALAQEGRLI